MQLENGVVLSTFVSFYAYPLYPLPAFLYRIKPEISLAGKGSKRERGLRPLSNTLPLSNNLIVA
jgi:hypothetical protein